jgi:hypothetical protein
MSLRRRDHRLDPSLDPSLRITRAPFRAWRSLLAAAVFVGAAAVAVSKPAANNGDRFPINAQGAISGAIGRDIFSYHALPTSEGLSAANRRHGLSIAFTPSGIRVESGQEGFSLSLHALGYGEGLSAVAPVAPIAQANRVEYCRETLTEWYVNGPFGLEQGFTLESPPSPRDSGPLTLALSITGDLTPSLEAESHRLVLERGSAALSYGALSAVDSAGRELPVRLELAEGALRLRIDDADARYPIVIDPFIQKATLVASDGKPEDFFGVSVAISGDTIVVGAYNPPHLDDFLPGAAYVFVKSPSGWLGTLTESAKLTGSDADSGSWFGISVAAKGDVIVVGASLHTVGANNSQGAAYVFVKPPTGWTGVLTEGAKLIASDGSAHDEFGRFLDVDGDTVVVGVPLDDLGGHDAQGSAYVFAKPLNGWTGVITESAKLTASDGAEVDQLGQGIGVSGDTVAAGAFGHGGFKIVIGPGGPEFVPISTVGVVYVFVKPPAGWSGALTENAKLKASDGDQSDALGISVAVNGDNVFAGAPGLVFGREGSAYVFVKPGSGWAGTLTETAKLTASDAAFDDHFGSRVAVAGSTALIGARSTSGSPGTAYLFVEPNAGWAGALTETEKVSSSSVPFCCTVAFGGNTIVVGEDSLERARVFQRPYIIQLDLAKLFQKIFNAGSTIPVKFQMADGEGTAIPDAEARRLSSDCAVRIFFSGGDPSPGCALWNGSQFQSDLKTSKRLAPGSYTITVKAFVGREEAGSASTEVRIR